MLSKQLLIKSFTKLKTFVETFTTVINFFVESQFKTVRHQTCAKFLGLENISLNNLNFIH